MKIGAVWVKKTKDGKPFMSMVIEFPGTKMQCAIFKNEDKQSDKQPDYNVIWSPPLENRGVTPAATPAASGNDDVPF